MGCDYYIVNVLYIYYNNNDYLLIELERERCYYSFEYDSDEDDYEEQLNNYVKKILTPQIKPITIYSDNHFHKLNYETKYKTIIENEMNQYNIKWSDVTKIIKVENRYER